MVEIRTKKTLYIAISLISVIAFISLFFTLNTSSSKLTTITGNVNAASIGLDVGNLAPNFQLIDMDGKSITRDTFAGKPLFIFFTTTWCVPCQLGAKNLAQYDLETGDKAFNVIVVFVDPQETNDQLKQWKQSFGREEWFIAKDNGMAQTYEVQYLDTKYVLDKNSIIRWKSLQPLTYETAKQVIGGLI